MIPQSDLFTAISKPLGVNRHAFVTFPKYDGATKRLTFPNSTPTRNTKMADFMQKYVHSYNAGYIEAILQIVMANVMFRNTAQARAASLKRWDCF